MGLPANAPGLTKFPEQPKTSSAGNSIAAQLQRSDISRMKTPTTDRRVHERFDVLGSLWGVLDLPETASIINASGSGLLIEANVCPVLESVHSTDIHIGGEAVRVESVVRHLHPGEAGKFLIGLEFIQPPTTFDSAIENLTPQKDTKVPNSGAS